MADIYDINFSQQQQNLNVPTKRLPKITDFLDALVYPLQWLRDLFLGDYKNGSSYAAYAFAFYSPGQRVLWTDKAIYENILFGIGVTPTGAANSALHWVKVNDNFIGANERLKYNSQIIILEYALNKWFLVPQSDPQIYIANNNYSPSFLMGEENDGIYSSKLSDDSLFSDSAMGDVYVNSTEFTVYFPVALFAALPPVLTLDKEKIIRNFVDKYRMAGITYDIITY